MSARQPTYGWSVDGLAEPGVAMLGFAALSANLRERIGRWVFEGRNGLI